MSEISSITAITLCEWISSALPFVQMGCLHMLSVFQTVGGAFFVSAGQTAFTNRLLDRVPITAPGIKPSLIVSTGATQLRNVFSPTELPGILVAYMDGLKLSFALAIALAGISVPIALFAKWTNVKPRPVVTETEAV